VGIPEVATIRAAGPNLFVDWGLMCQCSYYRSTWLETSIYGLLAPLLAVRTFFRGACERLKIPGYLG